MLFAWTREEIAGQAWRALVERRGYVPQHLDRGTFRELIARSVEVGGLIVNGDIDAEVRAIRAAPEQVVPRAEALRLLRR
jgi:hypothetical protein